MEKGADLHDRFDQLLEADVVVPDQFFADRARGPHEAERTLLIAVLEDAIHCFQKYAFATRPRYRQLFLDAYAWLMHEAPRPTDDSQPWFAFQYVCDALRIDPDYIRIGLQRWLDRQHAAVRTVPALGAARGTVVVLERAQLGSRAQPRKAGNGARQAPPPDLLSVTDRAESRAGRDEHRAGASWRAGRAQRRAAH